MTDVFDARFPARMAAGISNAVARWKNDPWCLGYFVENELPWAGWGSGPTEQYALPIGVLASTNALPAKAEFARLLQSRYSSVSRLNAAWNTSLASWNDISNRAVALHLPADHRLCRGPGRVPEKIRRPLLLHRQRKHETIRSEPALSRMPVRLPANRSRERRGPIL